MPELAETMLEAFIEMNGIDEKCAAILRRLEPTEKDWFCDQGLVAESGRQAERSC